MRRAEVELLFVEECPHVDRARRNLLDALAAAGLPPAWREWNLSSEDTPANLRGHGSPTVLVDGADVTSGSTPAGGAACLLSGAPGREEILAALADGSGRYPS